MIPRSDNLSGAALAPIDLKGILVAGTETDPEPETGDAGASAFLHGPEGLFAASIPTQMPGSVHDDQDRGDAEEAAR
ncbi:hypothetical protein [Streptomyces sp. NPDC002553]|uniref:hypothetical protein n=1 Tax=Streptomyces sp. NPDC002553 TaxID=3154417 RepID=UPI00331C85DA